MAQETMAVVQEDRVTAPSAPAEPTRRGPLPGMRLIAAIGGGVLLFLAFPPLNWWPLAPAAIALITLSVYGTRVRRAASLGLLAGIAFFLPALKWVDVIGADVWIMLSAFEGLYFAAVGAATAVAIRLRVWPLWVAALWVAQELVRGMFPLGGFPWARVAFSQGKSGYTSYASLGGAPLVTFAVALTGALLAFLALRTVSARAAGGGRGRRTAAAGVVAAFAGALVVPALGYAIPLPSGRGASTITVAVVQGNVPGYGMEFLGDEPAVVLANHANKTHELAAAVRTGRLPRPDLVLWPENSTDIDPYRSPEARDKIHAAVRDVGVPVLVGAVVVAPDDIHRRTRSLVWDPSTGPGAYYDKQKLVPFGEFVPFKDLLSKFFARVELVGRQSEAGTRPGTLRLGPAVIGAVNCYEVAFDGIVRETVKAGGTPLVVQTNNATYSFSNLPPQQLAMSKLRAVEHNRAVLTAATTGISAFVAPDGRVVWATRERVPDMRVAQVPVTSQLTIATRVGPWPEWILTLIGLGAVLVGVWAGRTIKGSP